MADHRLLDPAARLRNAREAKGLSHRQVAEATKLSVRTIDLLEKGELSELPEGIYRRSIIRAVAREVGLNPEQLLTEFAAQRPDDLPSPPVVVVAEPQAHQRSHALLALAGVLVPLIAGALYFGMPLLRTLTDRPAFTPVAIAPEELQRVQPLRAEVMPVGGFQDVAMPADTKRTPVVVTLTISSRCQLRIVADGTEIIGRTVEEGETLPIELGDELLLLGDNAAAVQFSINGRAGRLLGQPGDVLSARIGRDDYQDFLVRY